MTGKDRTETGIDNPTPISGALVAAPDEAIRRAVAAWVLDTRPRARRCRIVVDYEDDDRDTIAVPLTVPDDLESQVMEVLNRLKPGEWMKGRTLAAELGIDDPSSGHFRRAVGKNVAAGRAESGRNGYRAK